MCPFPVTHPWRARTDLALRVFFAVCAQSGLSDNVCRIKLHALFFFFKEDYFAADKDPALAQN